MVGGWRPLTVAGFRLGPAFNGFDLAATDPAAIPFPADRVLWTETSLFTGYCRSLKNFWAFRAAMTEPPMATGRGGPVDRASRRQAAARRSLAVKADRMGAPVALLVGTWRRAGPGLKGHYLSKP